MKSQIEYPIITKLGGRDAVVKALRVSTDVVRMWHQRGQISARGQINLALLATKRGIAFTPRDFRQRRVRK